MAVLRNQRSEVRILSGVLQSNQSLSLHRYINFPRTSSVLAKFGQTRPLVNSLLVENHHGGFEILLRVGADVKHQPSSTVPITAASDFSFRYRGITSTNLLFYNPLRNHGFDDRKSTRLT